MEGHGLEQIGDSCSTEFMTASPTVPRFSDKLISEESMLTSIEHPNRLSESGVPAGSFLKNARD